MESVWTAQPTAADALDRMSEAEDTLRAIGGGEVDAFVVSDGTPGTRVFMLSTADRPYRMFVENMRDGAATVSPSGLILYANRRLAELLSCSRETLVGTPLARYVPSGLPVTTPEQPGASFELELMDSDGAPVPVLVGTWLLEVDGEHLTCFTFADLSAHHAKDREIARLSQTQALRMADLQTAQVALTRQATHDALTGLPNRALLVDRCNQALSQAKRSDTCTAVLFVDLDRFKQINDTLGHTAGDAWLRRVADKLTSVLRPMDTVARIGGDEFVVLAPDVHDHVHAVEMSARLLGAIADGVQQGRGIGASVGIAVSQGGRGTAEGLLKEADAAMYAAKALGGGRAELFDAALGRQLQERSNAQVALRSALDERRVVVHYQPVVDIADGSVAGFEALARIATPAGGLVPPATFIPVAEESGLVVPLGSQVLELACKEACRWQPAGPAGRALAVAVNLSARQFEPGDLAAIVQQDLERSGLDPCCLHLELTETALIDIHPEILQQLARLRDLGVQIGLDDFGTGYASLTHLRRLPLTFVKIDQSFVAGLGTDHGDERIVAAVIDLAANLGLRSIGEGIETQAQLDVLRQLGCDQAQGYLFAHPLPAGDVPALLASRA